MAILYSNADIITTRLLQVQKADLVAVSNLTLSGEQTIDGVLTSTSTVLCTGQTTSAQNGVYTTSGGAWSRTTALDSDSDLSDWIGRSIEVQIGSGGTVYGLNSLGGLRYRIQPASAAATLGTDALVFEVVPGDYPLYSQVLTLATAQIDISDIVQIDGANIRMTCRGLTTSTVGTSYIFQWLGTGGTLDTTAGNYYRQRFFSLSTSRYSNAFTTTQTSAAGYLAVATDTRPSVVDHILFGYSSAVGFKSSQWTTSFGSGAGSGTSYLYNSVTIWENAGAVDTMRLIPETGSFEADTSINVWIEVR
jgi:hypothetical protein